MANTYRQKYYFTVKEHGNDTFHIVLEPAEIELPCLSNGFLGFDLKQGMTMVEAEGLAQILNQQIITISYTDLK
jgi:hypothetical protein